MREILFRGRRISDGSWVEGGIIKTFHPNFDHESPETFKFLNANCYCICANNRDIFVEQESIGQFTGLTDKNGKKIFEGDIVKIYLYEPKGLANYEIGCIKYDDTKVRFVFCAKEGSYGIDNTNTCEIIGNIHDNPELLRVDVGMAEYIKRSDAMKICQKYSTLCFASSDAKGQDIADKIEDEIAEITTADVRELNSDLVNAYKLKMKDALDDVDEEKGHANCDGVLCDLLTALGFGEIVEIYERQEKWYA